MNSKSYRTMNARYEGTCRECGKAINIGDRIAVQKFQPTVHADCKVTWLCSGRTNSGGVPEFVAIQGGKRVASSNPEAHDGPLGPKDIEATPERMAQIAANYTAAKPEAPKPTSDDGRWFMVRRQGPQVAIREVPEGGTGRYNRADAFALAAKLGVKVRGKRARADQYIFFTLDGERKALPVKPFRAATA